MPNNVLSSNPIPILYNSKKISELKGRTLLGDQENEWIVVSQYNPMLGSYYNIAMNLMAITSYAIDNSYQSTDYVIKTEMRNFIKNYNVAYLRDFAYVFLHENNPDIAYVLSYSQVASNVVSYTHSYIMDSVMWDHFPSHDATFNTTKYLCTEKGTKILADNNKNIII